MKLNEIELASSKSNAFELQDLSDVELNPLHKKWIEQTREQSRGPESWTQRKCCELGDALALSQIVPDDGVRILPVSGVEALQILVHMTVPVPVMPSPGADLVIEQQAVLQVNYPQEVMRQNLPGMSFVNIGQPRGVWLANANPVDGTLCLGHTLPRNIPLREVLWLTYSALAVQLSMWDERDEAGVINVDAARWWQLNQHRAPLTDKPLFGETKGEEK